MGELVWYPLDYLMLDSQLCELVNNLTLLVPTRRESFDEQPNLSRIKSSDNMNWNTLATHQEDSVPQEESSEEKHGSGPTVSFPRSTLYPWREFSKVLPSPSPEHPCTLLCRLGVLLALMCHWLYSLKSPPNPNNWLVSSWGLLEEVYFWICTSQCYSWSGQRLR